MCEFSDEADTIIRRSFRMRRATARRDRALILVLLDTGLRAFELCTLKVGDTDLKSGRIHVRHGVQGGSKGGKGRFIYLGKVCGISSGVIWPSGATEKMQMRLCSPAELVGR